jgi:hypothetical protein
VTSMKAAARAIEPTYSIERSADNLRRQRSGRGRTLRDHRATADVASEPEDQQNNQHKTEQPAAVVWGAPPGTTPVIVATASAKEKHQDDNQDQHKGTCLLPSSRVAAACDGTHQNLRLAQVKASLAMARDAQAPIGIGEVHRPSLAVLKAPGHKDVVPGPNDVMSRSTRAIRIRAAVPLLCDRLRLEVNRLELRNGPWRKGLNASVATRRLGLPACKEFRPDRRMSVAMKDRHRRSPDSRLHGSDAAGSSRMLRALNILGV